jgi:hypothetical protein
MSVRESPPAPASRSRTVMARMAVSSVVRMSGFFLCGEDAQIRAHRPSGLTGRQGLSPHGGRDCLSAYPRYHRQFQQDRRARPACGSGTRGLPHARTPAHQERNHAATAREDLIVTTGGPPLPEFSQPAQRRVPRKDWQPGTRAWQGRPHGRFPLFGCIATPRVKETAVLHTAIRYMSAARSDDTSGIRIKS